MSPHINTNHQPPTTTRRQHNQQRRCTSPTPRPLSTRRARRPRCHESCSDPHGIPCVAACGNAIIASNIHATQNEDRAQPSAREDAINLRGGNARRLGGLGDGSIFGVGVLIRPGVLHFYGQSARCTINLPSIWSVDTCNPGRRRWRGSLRSRGIQLRNATIFCTNGQS